jgi:hypothetical protein
MLESLVISRVVYGDARPLSSVFVFNGVLNVKLVCFELKCV